MKPSVCGTLEVHLVKDTINASKVEYIVFLPLTLKIQHHILTSNNFKKKQILTLIKHLSLIGIKRLIYFAYTNQRIGGIHRKNAE